jgi:hypothetical protein
MLGWLEGLSAGEPDGNIFDLAVVELALREVKKNTPRRCKKCAGG